MVFNTVLKPKTLAVIGVSMANDRHPANVIYTKNLLRYPVDVYAVNPKGGSLQGQQVYKTIAEVPVKVDLAVIAVRAEHVPATMAECIGAGVGGAVVISGGFAEIGKNDLQHDLLHLAGKANFPFVGPNCLGVYSPGNVDTFFLPSERMVQPAKGDVAIISQSGGILVDLMVKFAEEGIGVSHALSIGNKAQIREVQLLKHFAKDPTTKVIAFYVEGFAEKEGREFVLAAQKCPKPVIVLKAGKSAGGSRAVSSHTASLAGDYSVFSDVLEQFGVIEARNEFEMVSFCEALSCYQRSIQGNIGIVSGSGGHGALAVDVCSARGLLAPGFSQTIQDDLRARLSTSVQSIAAVGNPIDLTGSAIEDDFVVTAETLSRIPEIDCILLLLLPYLPGISSDLGARLSQVYRQERKPLVAYVPHVEKYRMLTEGFELNKVPVASSIEGAVMMAEALQRNKKA